MAENNTLEKALKMHEIWNGKIETTAKAHVRSREDLAVAYTPGVAEPCKVIAKDPEAVYKYTMKRGSWSWQYRSPCRNACHGGKSGSV